MSDHKLDLSLENTGKLVSILMGGESDHSIQAEADFLIKQLGDILTNPKPKTGDYKGNRYPSDYHWFCKYEESPYQATDEQKSQTLTKLKNKIEEKVIQLSTNKDDYAEQIKVLNRLKSSLACALVYKVGENPVVVQWGFIDRGYESSLNEHQIRELEEFGEIKTPATSTDDVTNPGDTTIPGTVSGDDDWLGGDDGTTGTGTYTPGDDEPEEPIGVTTRTDEDPEGNGFNWPDWKWLLWIPLIILLIWIFGQACPGIVSDGKKVTVINSAGQELLIDDHASNRQKHKNMGYDIKGNNQKKNNSPNIIENKPNPGTGNLADNGGKKVNTHQNPYSKNMSNVPPENSSSPPLMSSKGSNSPSGAKSNNRSNKKPNSGNNKSSTPGNSHSEPQGDSRTLLGELWEWDNPTTGERERWFKQAVAPFDFIYMGIVNDETEKSTHLEKIYK